MNYAEASFFDRNHCQHIADYYETLRLQRAAQSFTRLRRNDRVRNRAFA